MFLAPSSSAQMGLFGAASVHTGHSDPTQEGEMEDPQLGPFYFLVKPLWACGLNVRPSVGHAKDLVAGLGRRVALWYP